MSCRLSQLSEKAKARQKHFRETHPNYNRDYKKKYVQEHRQRCNKRMKQYHNEMRIIAREIGNCTACFKEKDNPKFLMCSKCRKYFKEYHKKYYAKNKLKKQNEEK